MSALFGFHMPNFTFTGVPNDQLFDHVAKSAKAAERAGFDLVTVMDHFYQISGIGPETDPMMEAYTTLSALATQTSRVLLGALVTGVTYRNPALLAKQVTSLDVISKGAAGSWQMENRWKAMNEVKFDGFGFAVDWMRKDLGICLEEAKKNGARLPTTAMIDQFYAQVQARGGARWDTSSLMNLLAKD